MYEAERLSSLHCSGFELKNTICYARSHNIKTVSAIATYFGKVVAASHYAPINLKVKRRIRIPVMVSLVIPCQLRTIFNSLAVICICYRLVLNY